MDVTDKALFQVGAEEGFYLVVGDHAGLVVVEIYVGGAGDDEQLLVAYGLALAFYVGAGHALKGVFAEIT